MKVQFLAGSAALALIGLVAVMSLSGSVQVESNTGRQLFSSDSCNTAAVARHAIEAWNSKHFEAGSELYTHDAMRFVNGKLDESTNGRPISAEEAACLTADQNIEVHIGDIVSNGEDVAAVSGTMKINREVSGVAFLFEFHVGSCKIQNERVFISTASGLYREWMTPACTCFPILEEMGSCHSTVAETDVDVVKSTEECWSALASGNAAGFAGCFEHGHRFVVNGITQDMDLSDVSAVTMLMSNFGYDYSIRSIWSEGAVVHTVVEQTIQAKSDSNLRATKVVFQSLRFNEEGKIAELIHVENNADEEIVTGTVYGVAPSLEFWETDAAHAIDELVAELGFPSHFTNSFGGPNSVSYMSEDIGNNYCFSSVMLMDSVSTHNMPIPHDVFMHVSVMTDIPVDMREHVRAVSDSLTYDTLTKTLTSTANNLGSAVVDLYLATSVAQNTMTVEEAHDHYALLNAKAYTMGQLSQQYFQYRDEVCASL